ncbi:MAG: integrin alpha, partial [Cyanobacteria bacterium J06638_22]
RNGFVISGIDEDDNSGAAVSSAGDINGDGIDDLIIGAPVANLLGGEGYVVFGSSEGFDARLQLSTLDGSNGFVITTDLGGFFSYSIGDAVSSAGDINGDGIDDLIIGAPRADSDENGEAGESYVVFGSSSGFDASLDLSALDGSNGFVINGIDSDDFSGSAVSSAGDINGDGIDDLIVGA